MNQVNFIVPRAFLKTKRSKRCNEERGQMKIL
jgi:hypothetical protein